MKSKFLLKVMGWLTVCFLLAMSSFVITRWKQIREMPKIVASFYSKSFCSCYYVMEQPEKYCHHFSRQYIPITGFKLQKDQKSVWVKSFGSESLASYTNHQNGCQIVE